ncbi:MAG: hypothetical protein NW241_08030 [Bacteroidia bacterium]|nr:hypothetical protein [Bacteroidia bacterium]
MLRTLLLLLGWAPCLLSAQSSASNGPFRYVPPAPETSGPELAFEAEIQSLLIERWSQRGTAVLSAQPAAVPVEWDEAWAEAPGSDAWDAELEAAGLVRDSLLAAAAMQARLWQEAHAMREAVDPRTLRRDDAPHALDLEVFENQTLAALHQLTVAIEAQDRQIVAIASRYAGDAAPELR